MNSEPTTEPEQKPFQFSISTMLVAVTALAILLSLGGIALRAMRDEARAAQCQNNLKQLALALHNYHDIHKQFPAAFVPGPDGKPWHSWRIALLPFMESTNLLINYRFDEPWDGPTNRTFLPGGVATFRCPSAKGHVTDTSYLAVTGPGTMWPDGKSISFADVTDGTSNTIMVVEVANSGVHWMEPSDLSIEDMDFRINGRKGKSISSNHVRGAAVVFADGHTKLLEPDTAVETLESWLLIDDGV